MDKTNKIEIPEFAEKPSNPEVLLDEGN